MKNKHIFIVDDDENIVKLYSVLLEKAGYKVTSSTSSRNALAQIIKLQPDCVLSDLIMPDCDGLDLFKKIRQQKNIKQPIFILITIKKYDYDRRRALEEGVDAFISKPINQKTFVKEIKNVLDEKMVIQFWGVRGTLPVSGKQNVRYGGNTNCVSLNFKKHFFIFDAGTGIKSLSNYLEQQGVMPINAKIFISHPHYDHINGFPFFAPLYVKGNQFEIFGTPHGDIDIKQMLSQQMDSIYFPITLRELSASLTFRNLSEETFSIDDVTIKTIFLNHPGRCLGYRIQYQNKSFCYITDNELPLEDSPDFNTHDMDRLIQFIHGADVVVMDTTYSDKEYLSKIHWGHSSVSRVIDVVDAAKVKLVCLFHHDPDQTDKEIDEKLLYAKALLKERHSKTKCIAPRDGDKLYI